MEDLKSYGWDDLPSVYRTAFCEERAVDLDGLVISRLRVNKGVDFHEEFQTLPDQLCQAAHWGFMVKGRARAWTDGQEIEIAAGQTYHAPAGHAFEFLEDTELIEVSQSEPWWRVMELVKDASELVEDESAG
jgi:hypothetical protein